MMGVQKYGFTIRRIQKNGFLDFKKRIVQITIISFQTHAQNAEL
jgi:hypothetical protein